MPRIEEIKEISPDNAKKLADIGILTTDDLANASRSAKLREELAKKMGVEPMLIMRWVQIISHPHHK
jgi:predicted RecB family nuclease